MKKQWLFLLVLIGMLILSACSGSTIPEGEETSGAGDAPASDGENEVVYASTSDAVGLSPTMTNDSVSSNVMTQIYENLFERNPETMELEPKLAESYENPDDLTWVIKLKEGIKFQDGTDFNAEAVKYSFDKLRDPATAAPRASLLEPVDTVTAIDETTVEIKTKYPYGPLLAALSHSNAAIISPTADEKQDLMQNPVGTGPFKFVSWNQGDEIVLEKNPDYWNGEVALDQVKFKVVPEISTAISMLQTGEVNFLDALPPEQISRIEGLENVEVTKQEGTPVYYLTFNHSRERNQNPDFRKAVASAVDRDAFVEKLNGLGVRSDSILGPKVFGYTEEADNAGTPYDPELAKQLVQENGFGNEPIKLLAANRDNFILMAEIVQSQLTEAGFKVEIETMEWATFLDTARGGEYDMTFLSWSNVTSDGSEMFYPNFHSDNVGNSNRAQYSNPEFDKLVEASRTTIVPEEREKFLAEANQFMLDDNAAIVMYHGVVTSATEKSIKGLKVDPNGQWSLANVSRE
ncbi:glutathione ABC transporter substrate-binding protein [Planococcus glaciei]|uniref:Glutathione ABC transporter substrate-binding protein n=1 Tax=Planococcus glaciei TaxID=459472 RepID=A0A7H8Q7G6_9BACL|nr:glutathione ABC transporter substrate-binding protein [Planococcus glaciei]ETP69034.1 ABC transporter substrate-binding protein [Planococcus glaciei CHR43]QKX49790.1 glutathione ABC transporter substrate-binding protein [Planococcus glaciei]